MEMTQTALNALKDKSGILQKQGKIVFLQSSKGSHASCRFQRVLELARPLFSTKSHCPATESPSLTISPSTSNGASSQLPPHSSTLPTSGGFFGPTPTWMFILEEIRRRKRNWWLLFKDPASHYTLSINQTQKLTGSREKSERRNTRKLCLQMNSTPFCTKGM